MWGRHVPRNPTAAANNNTHFTRRFKVGSICADITSPSSASIRERDGAPFMCGAVHGDISLTTIAALCTLKTTHMGNTELNPREKKARRGLFARPAVSI